MRELNTRLPCSGAGHIGLGRVLHCRFGD